MIAEDSIGWVGPLGFCFVELVGPIKPTTTLQVKSQWRGNILSIIVPCLHTRLVLIKSVTTCKGAERFCQEHSPRWPRLKQITAGRESNTKLHTLDSRLSACLLISLKQHCETIIASFTWDYGNLFSRWIYGTSPRNKMQISINSFNFRIIPSASYQWF